MTKRRFQITVGSMPFPLLLAFRLFLGSPALAQPQQSLTLAGQARGLC